MIPSLRFLFISVLLTLFPGFVDADAWTILVGGSTNDHAEAVLEIKEGGYYVAGWSLNDANYRDSLLVRLDSSGRVDSKRTFHSGFTTEFSLSMYRTPDGGFVAASTNRSILKFDSLGQLEWQTPRFFTFGHGLISGVIPRKGGGYVSAGSIDGNPVIVELDSEGNLVRSRQYERIGKREVIRSTLSLSNGWLFAGSKLKSFTRGLNEIVFIRVKSNGSVLWKKTYAGVGKDELAGFRAIVKTRDGGFAILSGKNLLKLDPQGNIQWQKKYSFTGTTFDVLKDGGYIIVLPEGVLARLNSNGDIQWIRKFKYKTASGNFNAIRGTKDGGFIAVGSMRSSLGAGRMDAWILKLDKDGSANGLCIAVKELPIFPPGNATFKLKSFQNVSLTPFSVEQFDIGMTVVDFDAAESRCKE